MRFRILGWLFLFNLGLINAQKHPTSEIDSLAQQINLQLSKFRENPAQTALIRLEKIEFDYNKAVLRPNSLPYLDIWVKILNQHPNMEISIEGHRDKAAFEEFKQTDISQKRADCIRTYFIHKGISANRLQAKGFADSKPLAKAPNPKNRRIEIVITKF